jgi:hypothetical protein
MRRLCSAGAVAIAMLFVGYPGFAEDVAPIRLEATTDAPTFCSRVQAAFTREDFGSLEATAERARSLEKRFPGSRTELQVFYESFAKEFCNQPYIYLTVDTGKARVALAEHWLGQRPDSPAARIVSAMIWNQYAWAARGRGFSKEVSAEQWATFSERVKRAAQFMLPIDPDGDAQAYDVLLNLARDLGVPRPQIDIIFRRARQRFPGYLAYYADYATILLPIWFGQPGELSDYLRSLLTEPGGDLGSIAYSRTAERLSFDIGSPNIYRDAGLTWEDLRHGFALRQSRDGLDKRAWTSLCYYAALAGDRAAAREAYRHVGHIDEWPVGGVSDFFLRVLPWIMERD